MRVHACHVMPPEPSTLFCRRRGGAGGRRGKGGWVRRSGLEVGDGWGYGAGSEAVDEEEEAAGEGQ